MAIKDSMWALSVYQGGDLDRHVILKAHLLKTLKVSLSRNTLSQRIFIESLRRKDGQVGNAVFTAKAFATYIAWLSRVKISNTVNVRNANHQTANQKQNPCPASVAMLR